MSRTLLIVVGVLSTLAGLYALFNPFLSTLAATKLAGWSFLILGALQIVAAIRANAWRGRIWALVLGGLAVLIGVEILGDPLAGVVALTLAVAAMFVVSGAAKVMLGLGLRGAEYRWAIVISGAISILLGLMIFRNFPGSASVLGILLGVELLSNGVSALALAYSGAPEGRRA